MPKPRKAAECHPERKHCSRGLCHSCYDKERAKTPNRRESKRRYAIKRKQDPVKFQKLNEARRKYKYSDKGQQTILKYRYGLNLQEVQTKYTEQGGSCAICKAKLVLQGSKFDNVCCIDHSHLTSKFRGLLCKRCNTGIGMFQEKESNFLSAIEYLRCYNDLQ